MHEHPQVDFWQEGQKDMEMERIKDHLWIRHDPHNPN
jgi:hypothetical protein